MSNHALATLTATYTDSEPEGDEEDRVLQDDKSKSSEDELSSRGASVEPFRPPEPQRLAHLVSYHDDAAEDEDEDGADPRAPEMEESPPPSDAAIELPPEPAGRISPRLTDKVTHLHSRMMAGLDMNQTIQNRKDFRNPSIYEKLIQFLGINELGTNYPPQIYNPLKWGKESFYEEISKVQKLEMERREKEKKDKTKVEFVVGTKKTGSVEEDVRKRKSKWDQVGQGQSAATILRATGLLQPSLTTAASGTKSTVISAFGSLPKKPKV